MVVLLKLGQRSGVQRGKAIIYNRQTMCIIGWDVHRESRQYNERIEKDGLVLSIEIYRSASSTVALFFPSYEHRDE
jgi:hypothetical protein